MINLYEYLLSKSNRKSGIIVASDDTLYRIVRDEISKLGKDADLNHIDVSEVKDFFYGLDMDEDSPENLLGLFEDTGFCGDVSSWDMHNAKCIDWLFNGCKNFDCDISKWDVSSVQSCRGLFYGCEAFFQDLTKWDLSNVKHKKNRLYMFENSGMTRGMQYWPKFGY